MAVSYQVKQGDCIFSIAYEHGFFADTIWNHPNNKDLKEKRKDPNVLMPGDSVYVPDKRLREYSEATNQVYKYKCKNTPKLLRIQLMYIDTPVKGIDYKISIDGGVEKDGTTDPDGWLQTSILPKAKKVKISMEGGIEYEIALGYLNPADEVSGIQGRLAHLGFYEGKVDGVLNPEIKNAVKAFQISQNLEATGEIDSSIEDLLKQLTGV